MVQRDLVLESPCFHLPGMSARKRPGEARWHRVSSSSFDAEAHAFSFRPAGFKGNLALGPPARCNLSIIPFFWLGGFPY